MNILLIGATGRTGEHVLAKALERGHRVTALVRSRAKLTKQDAKLEVVEGNPLDQATVERHLASKDAVVSALGAVGRGPTTLHADGARALTAAMARSGTKRLVIVSTALLFEGMGLIPAILRRFVFGNVVADSREMERVVTASNLDWTVMRPPRLLDGPGKGKYRAEKDRLPGGSAVIDRIDLARAIVDELERGQFVRSVVGVAR